MSMISDAWNDGWFIRIVMLLIVFVIVMCLGAAICTYPHSATFEGVGSVRRTSWSPARTSTTVGYAPNAGPNGGGSVVVGSTTSSEKFEALVILDGVFLTAGVAKSEFGFMADGDPVDVFATRNIFGSVIGYRAHRRKE